MKLPIVKLTDLAGMFNRSWEYAFSVRKFLFMFLTLVIVGLIFLFFQALAPYSSPWVQFAFRFAPFFISAALLMGMGIFLIKTYVKEKEEGPSPVTGKSIKSAFLTSSKAFIVASYFALALLGAFIGFWILLGLFILLKSIPYIGVFFGVILAFVPFLLNLAILLLLVAVLGSLFFFTPIVAEKNRIERKDLTKRLRTDLCTHTATLAIAFIPVWIAWLFVRKAAQLTFKVYSTGDNHVVMVLQAFFMLIPFAAAMAFPLIYFFNFALESFQLLESTPKNIPTQDPQSFHV